MKKLMIVAFAAALAAVTQASTCNWTIGELNGPGLSGGWGSSVIDGEGVYNATLYISASVTGDSTSGYQLGELVDLKSGFTSDYAEEGYMGGVTANVLTDDATYYAKIIVTTGDYTLESQIVEIHTSSASGKASPSFGADTGNITALPGMSLDDNYGAFSSAGWQSVPEPTSGLLLLIGVAGLALRRRRA